MESRSVKEEQAEGKSKPGDGEEGCWMLPSGHDAVIRLRHAQQLWLPAQDLSKVKPAQIPSQVELSLTH